MIGIWGECVAAAWPLVRCKIGLHKWRDVQRHVPGGFTVYILGVPCASHWKCVGERCKCCGKFAKDRTPWWVWLTRIVTWVGPPAALIAMCAYSGMWWALWLIAGLLTFTVCAIVAAFG